MIELRAQQVIIDTPRLGSEPFIAVVVQRIIFDANGDITQTINRERMLNSSFANRAMETYPIVDPVPSADGMISVAGIGFGIEEAVRAWILQEYPEAYLENDRVLIDDTNS